MSSVAGTDPHRSTSGEVTDGGHDVSSTRHECNGVASCYSYVSRACRGVVDLICSSPRKVVNVDARECICSLVDVTRRQGRTAAGAGLVGLAVGSFCCAAAATKMRVEPVWLPILFRVFLAMLAVGGFVRLFARRYVSPTRWHRMRIFLAYFVALTMSSVAATIATVIAVITAIRMYLKAAVDYGVGSEQRRWFSTIIGLSVDVLELGALMLQMILMTQRFFDLCNGNLKKQEEEE
ncbi:hypothetical protein GUITHDRAFT_166868 [Guillardia theta CCMP2712]|uniref:Uncharacterized protein n=1 Tax=Guillardia theta (strain CCMP2712) TaxID=905079 RepID=L1I6K4_GUITC|nr:hypothetical protein GUITHDRAFT_166868 [Guillardia theta CCMP2712]EKX31514.1 hypothetical protein GUITHDRAFT_166868 [Guillardia theta CCMP2712]|eukprot:XP_005818494.1 hypothetical protein GUITHDRAFT_166868 [Guillardia theta CCMP2712]